MQAAYPFDGSFDSFVRSQIVTTGLGPSGKLDPLSIGGHSGYKVQYSGWDGGCSGPGYFIQVNNKEYIYVFTGRGIEDDQKVIDQILSTFKFTNSVDSKSPGTLSGHVTVGPLCPGPERINQPCKTKPDYSATQIIIIYKIPNPGTPFQRTISVDSAGNYNVELPPAEYLVSYKTNYGLSNERAAQDVVIAAGKTATLDFNIDTGIR
jgi:hypothetical protein